MKLHYSATSPYVRKVMAVAIEAGLADRLDKVPAAASPVGVNDTLNRDNPLGKVPCLVTDDGQALFDSRVICEYLDSLAGGRLFRSEEHTSELQSLMRLSSAVFCLKK